MTTYSIPTTATSYANAYITRNNPTCVLFLIDQSSSMGQQFGDRMEGLTKAAAVAQTLNNLLRSLIITCTKSDGIRNYFDVGVVGYGERVGSAWSGPLYGRELVPVSDVAHYYSRVEEKVTKTTDVFGNETEQRVKVPVWIEPVSRGSTLMCQGLQLTFDLMQSWLMRNQMAHPPTIIHITDGEATDGDPAPLMQRITQLQTSNGPATLFNVHLSSTRSAAPTSFPDSPDGLPDSYAKMLFERASHLTEYMRNVAWDNQLTPTPAARAFVLNADPSLLALAMEIGTRAGHVR